MESPAPPSLLQHLWKSTLLSGVLAVILGVLAWTWPTVTIIVTAIFFGAYLLVTGISQVVFAFSLHVSAGGRVLLFISGAAALILARAVLPQPAGIDPAAGHLDRHRLHLPRRRDGRLGDQRPHPARPGWEIFIGVLSLVAGIFMLAWPLESLETLTRVVGIWLIVIGVFEVVSAFGIRKASKGLGGDGARSLRQKRR